MKQNEKAIELINEYIEELSWVNSTEEELKNVKIINRLKKIIKELDCYEWNRKIKNKTSSTKRWK